MILPANLLPRNLVPLKLFGRLRLPVTIRFVFRDAPVRLFNFLSNR